MFHRAGKYLAFTIFVTVLLAAPPDLKAAVANSHAAQKETCPFSEVERNVLAHLKREGKADMGELSNEKRVIKACFLRRLLTDSIEGLKLGSNGVRIKNAVIEGNLELYNEKIPYSVSLIGCEFRGMVKFFNVNIAGDLNISDHFITFEACDENKGNGQGTIFKNRALFINVVVAGDLLANYSQFLWHHPASCTDVCDEPNPPCDAAGFQEVKVANDAFFIGAVFAGFADFEGAHFSQVFSAEDAQFKDQADFVDIRVTDDALFDKATFASVANFGRAEIKNKFGIAGTSFKESQVNFQDMRVGQIVLNNETNFCQGKPQANVGGMTYQRIAYQPSERQNGANSEQRNIGNDEQAWRGWLNVIDHSPYRVDAYAALEDFIEKQGQPTRADEVYIRLRDLEAGEVFRTAPFTGGVLWCWDSFVKWTVGYGRWPWLALIYSLLIIAIGCYLFPYRKMTPREEWKEVPYYNRLWFSADLFLPVVDLQANEAWMPNKKEHPILWHYMHVHALLGWILVPIGLAALTGIIK
jgi:hypothetical protein